MELSLRCMRCGEELGYIIDSSDSFGVIVKIEMCESCLEEEMSQAHHDGYNLAQEESEKDV